MLYVQDQGGDENYNVYAVDPSAAPAAGQDVPAARNVTDAKGARALIYDVPKNEPGILYIGLNDRDKAWHDLYRLEIATGKRTLMRQNTEKIAGWVFDNAGKLRLAARTTDSGSTEILRVDDKGFTPVYTCSVFESCGPVQFHKDGQRVYLETSKGEGDLSRLTLFDPATGKEELVESDPAKKVDFGAAHFSEVTDELVATTYLDDKPRWYFRDKALEADFRLLEKKLAGRTVNLGSRTADEQMLDRQRDQRRRARRDVRVRPQDQAAHLQYKIREKLPREALSPMTPVRYTSTDGLEIPAYLTMPKGTSGKNMPAIVVPHGGPWARDDWGYDGIAQFLSNRGYVVLQPNFRGSTGYGKKFLNAGNKQWGDLMQDDLTWGVKYLVAKGIADPKRVGILGGSYGGYATLAGLAFTPDVYAAGVSIVGPSNIITLLDSIPPYWEAIRTVFNERLGNPRHTRGTQAAGAAVADQLGQQDHDAAAGAARRQRPAREAGRVGSDRHRAARSRLPGRVHRRAGRGPRVCPAGEQHGRLCDDREVPRQAPRRPLPGNDDAGGRQAAEGDHRRPEDRGAHEEGRHGQRRHAQAGRRSGAVDRELQGHHRRQRPDDPDGHHQHREGRKRRLGGVGDRQDADGRHAGHHHDREGHARS